MPVLVCKHFSITPPPSISSIPSSAPAITFVGMITISEKKILLYNALQKHSNRTHELFSPEFLLPGSFTGLASAAIACNE